MYVHGLLSSKLSLIPDINYSVEPFEGKSNGVSESSMRAYWNRDRIGCPSKGHKWCFEELLRIHLEISGKENGGGKYRSDPRRLLRVPQVYIFLIIDDTI